MQRRRSVTAPLVILVVVLVLAAISSAWQAPKSDGRLIVVIGDLHMGIGKDSKTGHWHPQEDFRWRCYIVKTRQYQIGIGWLKGKKPAEEIINTFLNSLKLTAE